MNIDAQPLRLFRRVLRWWSSRPVNRSIDAHGPERTLWAECHGRPYLVGTGTFLVLRYLQPHGSIPRTTTGATSK